MSTTKPVCNVTVNGVGYYDPNSGTGISAISSSCALVVLGCTIYLVYQGNLNAGVVISAVLFILCLASMIRNAVYATKDESTKDCTPNK